jgi:hypothetical protein
MDPLCEKKKQAATQLLPDIGNFYSIFSKHWNFLLYFFQGLDLNAGGRAFGSANETAPVVTKPPGEARVACNCRLPARCRHYVPASAFSGRVFHGTNSSNVRTPTENLSAYRYGRVFRGGRGA